MRAWTRFHIQLECKSLTNTHLTLRFRDIARVLLGRNLEKLPAALKIASRTAYPRRDVEHALYSTLCFLSLTFAQGGPPFVRSKAKHDGPPFSDLKEFRSARSFNICAKNTQSSSPPSLRIALAIECFLRHREFYAEIHLATIVRAVPVSRFVRRLSITFHLSHKLALCVRTSYWAEAEPQEVRRHYERDS